MSYLNKPHPVIVTFFWIGLAINATYALWQVYSAASASSSQ